MEGKERVRYFKNLSEKQMSIIIGEGIAQNLCDTGNPLLSHAEMLENFQKAASDGFITFSKEYKSVDWQSVKGRFSVMEEEDGIPRFILTFMHGNCRQFCFPVSEAYEALLSHREKMQVNLGVGKLKFTWEKKEETDEMDTVEAGVEWGFSEWVGDKVHHAYLDFFESTDLSGCKGPTVCVGQIRTDMNPLTVYSYTASDAFDIWKKYFLDKYPEEVCTSSNA